MERSGTGRARSLLAPGYLGTAARPAPRVTPQPAEPGANPCCCSAWSARDCCAQPRVGARTETASSRIVRARRVRRIRLCDDMDRSSTPTAADPHPTPPTSDPMTGNPDGAHAWRSDVQTRYPDITRAGPAPISGAPHVVSAPRWRGYWLDDEWRWCDAHHDPGGMSRRYYGQKRRCRHRYHHLAPHHRLHSEVRTRVIRTIRANPPRRLLARDAVGRSGSPQRGRCCVPKPAVMKTAVAAPATSAVCQVPGSLMAYSPGRNGTLRRDPSGLS